MNTYIKNSRFATVLLLGSSSQGSVIVPIYVRDFVNSHVLLKHIIVTTWGGCAPPARRFRLYSMWPNIAGINAAVSSPIELFIV